MAIRRVWIGSIGPFLYDDTETYPGEPTELIRPIRTDDPQGGGIDVEISSGTYTPSLVGAGGSAGSYSDISFGQWQRINDRVYGTALVAVGDPGSWTGGIRMTLPPGQPFSSNHLVPVPIDIRNYSGGAGILVKGLITSPIDFIQFSQIDLTDYSATVADWSNYLPNMQIAVSFKYLTS